MMRSASVTTVEAIGTLGGGSCFVGANENKHQLVVRAIGSEGQVLVDLEREDVWLWRPDGTEVRPELAADAGVYDCAGPVGALVDLALGRDVANSSPGELGARTVELLHAAYRSAETGTVAQVA